MGTAENQMVAAEYDGGLARSGPTGRRQACLTVPEMPPRGASKRVHVISFQRVLLLPVLLALISSAWLATLNALPLVRVRWHT